MHRLELMLRLRMLEKQKAWKREAGFDRIEIIAEVCAQHFLAGFESKPFYSKLHNPKWPHSSVEQKLDMTKIGNSTFADRTIAAKIIYHRDGRPRSVRGRTNPDCHALESNQ